MRQPFTTRLAPIAALAVLTAACQDGPAEPFSSDQLHGVRTQQVALHGAPGQEELVDAIPGFGGLYLDDDGVPTINVTNINEIGDADLAALGHLSRLGVDAPPQVRIRQAEFSIPQLDEWFTATAPAVLAVDGAVFVDLDDKANRITIGVEDAGMIDQARRIAEDLGVPGDAVQIVLTEPIVLANSLQDRHRPTVGGLQINFPGFLCTLGFNAQVQGTGGFETQGNGKGKGGGGGGGGDPTPEDSFITNSHCTNNQGGIENTPYWQPLRWVDPVQIATEVDDPKYQKSKGKDTTCPRGFVCRMSDASRARYESGIPFTLGAIAMPDAGPNVVSVAWTTGNIWTITAEGTAVVGNTVNKAGRTTGWSQGTVTNTNVNTQVSGTNIVQLGQTFVSSPGDVIVGSGDSGSPAFMITGGNNVTLVGILWGSGGSSLFVYSPLTNIEAELGNLTVF